MHFVFVFDQKVEKRLVCLVSKIRIAGEEGDRSVGVGDVQGCSGIEKGFTLDEESEAFSFSIEFQSLLRQ